MHEPCIAMFNNNINMGWPRQIRLHGYEFTSFNYEIDNSTSRLAISPRHFEDDGGRSISKIPWIKKVKRHVSPLPPLHITKIHQPMISSPPFRIKKRGRRSGKLARPRELSRKSSPLRLEYLNV